MRLLVLIFFLMCFVCIEQKSSIAANIGDLLGDIGDVLSDRVPPTCDANFWDVMASRAWEEAQREVTQNANLVAKPDSVLVYSCFDQHMHQLYKATEDGFPSDPNESMDESFLGSLGWELFMIEVKLRTALNDPFVSEGLDMGSSLEILILDTMVNNVSNLQVLGGSTDDIVARACSRDYYLEDSSFDTNVLGNRGIGKYMFDDNLDDDGWGNCERMQAVWNQAKCYSAISEPSHDGFFQRATYEDTGGNYRPHIAECSGSSGFIHNLTDSGVGGMICDAYFHDLPAIPLNLYWPLSGVPPMTWANAKTAANPAPNAPGGVEEFKTLAELYNVTDCTTTKPIKTGVVVHKDGATYDDAYCIVRGCEYDPVVSTTECQPVR